ncbi:MAG: hypothetical protein HQL37_14100 [Alphaproteobacteria bacterium]|nr:hypothetical protein [Alphaproteobacteria bacterium]
MSGLLDKLMTLETLLISLLVSLLLSLYKCTFTRDILFANRSQRQCMVVLLLSVGFGYYWSTIYTFSFEAMSPYSHLSVLIPPADRGWLVISATMSFVISWIYYKDIILFAKPRPTPGLGVFLSGLCMFICAYWETAPKWIVQIFTDKKDDIACDITTTFLVMVSVVIYLWADWEKSTSAYKSVPKDRLHTCQRNCRNKLGEGASSCHGGIAMTLESCPTQTDTLPACQEKARGQQQSGSTQDAAAIKEINNLCDTRGEYIKSWASIFIVNIPVFVGSSVIFCILAFHGGNDLKAFSSGATAAQVIFGNFMAAILMGNLFKRSASFYMLNK